MKRLLLSFLLVAGMSLWAGSISYQVTASTGIVSGGNGYLSLQFNPGGTSDAATAVISNVTGFSVLDAATLTGGASGSVGTSVTIVNSGAVNEYLQRGTFGTTLSFLVSFSGPLFDNPVSLDGSAFSLNYVSDDQQDFETNLWISFLPGLEPDILTDTTRVEAVNPVPEPSTMALALLALPVGIYLKRRK
jgi:hypothetical protein